MYSNRSQLQIAVVCVGFVLICACHAMAQRGAVVLPRNLTQLTENADSIVQGRIVWAHVEPHPQYRNLMSVVVTVSVADTLKGSQNRTVTFRQFIWDQRDRADAAGYRRGDNVILFLNAPTEIGFVSPVGLTQGRFRIQRGHDGQPMVANLANNVHLLEGVQTSEIAPRISAHARAALTQAVATPGPMSLSDFKEVVRAMAKKSGGQQ
jgi:hypothetical protein